MPAKVATMPEDNRILFYERDREAFGFLSNFHLAPVVIDKRDLADRRALLPGAESHRSGLPAGHP